MKRYKLQIPYSIHSIFQSKTSGKIFILSEKGFLYSLDLESESLSTIAINPNIEPINENKDFNYQNSWPFDLNEILSLGRVSSAEIFDQGNAVAVCMDNKDFFILYLHYAEKTGQERFSALVNPRIPRQVLMQESLTQYLFAASSEEKNLNKNNVNYLKGNIIIFFLKKSFFDVVIHIFINLNLI